MLCLKAMLIALCLPRVLTIKFTSKSDYYDIGIADLTGVTSFTFDVKTCEAIALYLCGVNIYFECVLTYSWILRNDVTDLYIGYPSDPISQNTPNILDCGSFRAFWISWDKGYIQLGAGRDIGKETILMHSIDHTATSDVKVLEVRAGVNGSAEWDITPSNQTRRKAFFRKHPFCDPIAEILANLTTHDKEHCAHECLSNLRCNSFNIDQSPEEGTGLYRCQLKATYLGVPHPQASALPVDRWEMIYN
ncbi:uncharacterized protein LOC106155000 isoform X1 [Lingula anatina]|uniref:Uncharacterized protein LOC106155000 isoform X1 n=1 Tax=Lingula anatina TaxID=7574 RepID=A0A2R2ML46_LINAN|nr:uncharacterized protein LOC106155000 isoform X1 [Lingula anatina]|eukprot:XP_023930787.1 uncharacterized protein LOC106155000 isoform X1 [Lingula anatina]